MSGAPRIRERRTGFVCSLVLNDPPPFQNKSLIPPSSNKPFGRSLGPSRPAGFAGIAVGAKAGVPFQNPKCLVPPFQKPARTFLSSRNSFVILSIVPSRTSLSTCLGTHVSLLALLEELFRVPPKTLALCGIFKFRLAVLSRPRATSAQDISFRVDSFAANSVCNPLFLALNVLGCHGKSRSFLGK